MSCRSFLLCVVVIAKVQAILAGEISPEKNEVPFEISENDAPCSIYLATSSIPGAGWGVFAARNFSIGDKIGTPSIGIPFLDMTTNIEHATSIHGALPEFLWESAAIGGFGEGRRVDLFLPGPASLVNHHAALENVLAGDLTHDGNFYRHSSPMAGSMTAYTNFHLIAKRDINAGEELFIDRSGNSRFPHPSYRTKLPVVQDYNIVDETIQGIANEGLLTMLTEAQFNDLLYRLKEEVIETGYKGRAKILQDIFPKSKLQFERCLELGIARCGLMERNLGWLETNGHCMDTMTSRQSTIPEAGQGAFATRPIPMGSVVSFSPMVTIPNATLAMDVPYTTPQNTPPIPDDFETSTDTYIPRMRHNNATQQLLKNYCFGHTNSDLLLCPTTHAALINHADVTARPQHPPNIGVRWHMDYEHFTLQHLSSITNISHSDLSSYQTRLAMEFVAIRDIQRGDELLLDYSNEWQKAYDNHLGYGHTSSDNIDPYRLPAKSVNEMKRPIELSVDVRPKHLAFLCDVFPNIKIVDDASSAWEDFHSNSAVHKEFWPEKFRHWYRQNEPASLYPCNVVRVDRYHDLYDVQMLVKPLIAAQIGRMFRNIPGNRIRYADSIYHSDMHLEWAFRNHIPIPDAIFPLKWRREYRSAKDIKLGKHSDIKGTSAAEESYEHSLRQTSCGVYLAQSNIPNAGFGTYAAVDIPGDIVVSTLAPMVPAFGPQNNHHEGLHWPGQDYVWSSDGIEAANTEAWPKLSTSMLHGLFGALANAHPGITNLQLEVGKWEAMLDGMTQHGAGSFSDYVSAGFQSMYSIPAGEELFVTYGEHWFRGRSEYAEIPLSDNYKDANEILASIWAFVSTAYILDDENSISRLLSLMTHFVEKDNVRTKSAIDTVRTLDDLRHVVARNGTAEATVAPRSQQWLETNGYCQDHLYVKKSTLSNAGNGAFSRRFLLKDSLILASPTIATRRELLQMNISTIGRQTNEFQLMTNYHLGHANSSVLFFPINQAIAINHNSERREGGIGPNARVQFSTSDKRSMYFQSLPLEDILEQKYSTMIIDFIATRDIQPDEEIFIDYGKEWEEAWVTYVKEWQSPCQGIKGDCFTSKQVNNMNKDKFNKTYHQWTNKHISVCHFDKTMLEANGEIFDIPNVVSNDFNDRVVGAGRRKFLEGIDFNHEGFDLPIYQLDGGNFMGKPCQILEGYNDTQTFDIIFFGSVAKSGSKGYKKVTYLKNAPQKDVRFKMRPFQSDMMDFRSFRHEIGFPDDLFPSLWKDLEGYQQTSHST